LMIEGRHSNRRWVVAVGGVVNMLPASAIYSGQVAAGLQQGAGRGKVEFASFNGQSLKGDKAGAHHSPHQAGCCPAYQPSSTWL